MRLRGLGVLLVTLAIPVVAAADKPTGWILAGSAQSSYSMELDRNVVHDAKASGRLASVEVPKGFGTMMQSFDAKEYRGKRVRLSGFVKSTDVSHWAGLWMRVDRPNGQPSGAFDNMQERPIKGTKDWARYEIVVDVAGDAVSIAFGVLIDGPGTVWVDNFDIAVVDKSVPTTGTAVVVQPSKPQNLNFEN